MNEILVNISSSINLILRNDACNYSDDRKIL